MNIEVTVKAAGEHSQLRRAVRCHMAAETFRDLAVHRMTLRTVHLTMLAGGSRPFGVNLRMAAAADRGLGLRSEADLPGLVNRMAFCAAADRLILKVRFMAFETGRNISVPVMMTGGTPLFGMFTGELLELPDLLPVAVGAEVLDLANFRGQGRSMGIMTGETKHLLVAVRLIMTHPALRHQVGIVAPEWVEGMNDLVAVLAVELVFSTVLLQAPVMHRMALCAFDRSQRHRIGGINVGRFRRCAGSRRESQKGKTADNQNGENGSPKSVPGRGHI